MNEARDIYKGEEYMIFFLNESEKTKLRGIGQRENL